MYDFKLEYPHDADHLTFPNTADEIRKQAAVELEQKDNGVVELKINDYNLKNHFA